VQVAASADCLLDLVVAALHIDAKRLPFEPQAMLHALHAPERALQGRKALIVDDDMRNIFALATIMEDLGMRHVWADNGRDAIRQVEADTDIEIVLMDIMMPEMDGLTTMREIRRRPVGQALPIIAVTAKAMKGDREKCIEAGAWDYLSKPVNRDDLLAVLHAWLHR
jgi:CheY-like chemotaxis protein